MQGYLPMVIGLFKKTGILARKCRYLFKSIQVLYQRYAKPVPMRGF
jgi:hypothetical protein